MKQVCGLLLGVYLAFCTALAGVAASDIEDLRIFTEDVPPYGYFDKGVHKGLSVDLLLAILERANIPKKRADIITVPWSRGYAETLRRKNTMLFTATRTPEREHLFKWVGPIGMHQQVFIARKKAGISDFDPKDINKYSYGVVRQTSAEQRLLAAGAKPDNIIHITSQRNAAQMLARGRVDICVLDQLVAFWLFQELGFDEADFVVIHNFKTLPLYYALNIETDDSLVANMQAALDALRADGSQRQIVESYLPGAAFGFLPTQDTLHQ